MGSARTPPPHHHFWVPWTVPISLASLEPGWGVSPGVWAVAAPHLPLSLPAPPSPNLRAVRLEKKAEDGLQVVAVGGELSVPGVVALHLEGLLRTQRGLWTSSLRIKYGLLGTAPCAGLGGGGRWQNPHCLLGIPL